MIKVIETVEDFEGLREVWQTLAQSPAMQVFQTYDWCYWAWVKMLSKDVNSRLFVLCWTGSKGETPIILPTYIDGTGALRFINDTHSDCCSAVYVPGGNKHVAFKEIADFIQADKRIKRVVLQKLHADSELLHYLGVFWKDAVIYRDNTYSWVDVTRGPSFVESLTHMKTKDRSCLKAILRKSEGDEVEIASVVKGRKFPREEIVALRGHMLEKTNRTIDFLPDELIDFVEKIYEAGFCEIVFLKNGGMLKSLSFQMYKDSRTLCWIFMYEDPAFNLPLYLRYFDARVQEMDLTVDFGVGTYDYKMGSFRPRTECTFGIRWGRSYLDAFRSFGGMNWRLLKDFIKTRRKMH